MSKFDKEQRSREKANSVIETAEVITTQVYRVTPEQKAELDRLAEERLEQARRDAVPKLRERYEQRMRERRNVKRPTDNDDGLGALTDNDEGGAF